MEDELRQKLKEARAVDTDLEMQLSEVTGRPTATQIKMVKEFAPLTDEDFEIQILCLVQKVGEQGMSAADTARRLNQNSVRIRGWVKRHPGKLRIKGGGRSTSFQIP